MGLRDYFKKRKTPLQVNVDFPTIVVFEYRQDKSLPEKLNENKSTRKLCNYLLTLNYNNMFLFFHSKNDKIYFNGLVAGMYDRYRQYEPLESEDLQLLKEYKEKQGVDFGEVREAIFKGEKNNGVLDKFAKYFISAFKESKISLNYCDKDLIIELFDYAVRNEFFQLYGPIDNERNSIRFKDGRNFLRQAAWKADI